MLTITLNGEKKGFESSISIAELLTHLDVKVDVVVVERNLEIVKRPDYNQVKIAEGDNIEVLHFVGGGSEDLETVFESDDFVEVELAQEVLTENGIESFLEEETFKEIFPINVSELLISKKLKVFKPDAFNASRLLEDWVQSRGEDMEEELDINE